MERMLPASFRFGVATSAYQIEGATDVDGRTPSIWDTFSRRPGAIADGATGDVACDHYHRMPEDVALIADLGVDTYRFSVSWPRVQPRGRGPINPSGIGFYDRLVDELLARGVRPWVTLYHWDLPQELQDAGGWPARDTAYRFADYASLVFDRLGDRADTVTTFNEPYCVVMLGHSYGTHAPGHRDLGEAVDAAHHVLLGHGLAVERMRAAATRPVDFGITFNLSTILPASDTALDRDAAHRADGFMLRLYLDALRKGRYPDDIVSDLAWVGHVFPVRDDDMAIISTPFEVLGVNYYTSLLFSGIDDDGATHDARGIPVERLVPRGVPATALGWEVVPDQLTALLLRLQSDYPGLGMVISENGAAYDDHPDEHGHVDDADREHFLRQHLDAVVEAHRQGVDVRGYFVWTLMDNFEWQYGYTHRFGIIHVDFATGRRTAKRSARWYRDTIRRFRTVPTDAPEVAATA